MLSFALASLADGKALASLRVGALRASAANRFYLRHGFVPDGEGEFDLYYRRAPGP